MKKISKRRKNIVTQQLTVEQLLSLSIINLLKMFHKKYSRRILDPEVARRISRFFFLFILDQKSA